MHGMKELNEIDTISVYRNEVSSKLKRFEPPTISSNNNWPPQKQIRFPIRMILTLASHSTHAIHEDGRHGVFAQ